jgi:hypothetical protein
VALLGQPQADQNSIAFEVASIKPTSVPAFGLRQPPSPDRFVRQSVTLSELLAYIYLRLNGSGTPTITMRGTSISRLARVLQDRAGRVIVDKTGLGGAYDVEFETELPSMSGPTTTPPRESLSLFTVLEEQLGLKLESERGPVDVLVIDHVERPTPD